MRDVESKPSAAGGTGLAGKYLTFMLGQEHYGVPVLKVREIIRYTAVTPVPHTQDYIKGVLNLRGKVIPICDLRLKFRLAHAEIAERTCVIVAQVATLAGNRALMGFVVDGVEAVTLVNSNDIEPTPDFGGSLDTQCLLGIAKHDGKVIALLNLDEITCGHATEPHISAFSPAATKATH